MAKAESKMELQELHDNQDCGGCILCEQCERCGEIIESALEFERFRCGDC